MVVNVNKREYVNDNQLKQENAECKYFYLSSALFAWLKSGFPFVVREIIKRIIINR